MHKQIALFSALATSLLVSFSAQAADTTELKVKGVIRPSACTPTFTGGGIADYGTIPASSLKAGQYTSLGDKEISFAISCDGATKMAIKVADNRAGSVVPEAVAGITASLRGGGPGWAPYLFGLGTVAGKNVGSYIAAFKQDSYTADSVKVDTISSTDAGASWFRPSVGAFKNGGLNAWAAAGTTLPGAYKQVSGTVLIHAALNKPENLPLTQDVPLDGSATLELLYL